MKQSTLSICAAIATCMLFFSDASVAQEKSQAVAAAHTKNKVVFQVSDADPKKWGVALNNIKNVQEELGKDNVTVELVAYGPGIGMLKFDSEVGSRIGDAVTAGVKVVACENTMKSQHIAHEDMHPAISYARAGVVEIMKLQQDGYAYIRP